MGRVHTAVVNIAEGSVVTDGSVLTLDEAIFGVEEAIRELQRRLWGEVRFEFWNFCDGDVDRKVTRPPITVRVSSSSFLIREITKQI